MEKMRILACAISTGIACSAAFSGQQKPESREQLLDRMHVYYVKQFEDLEAVKRGEFGVSRIEKNDIKKHARRGGDPGLASRDWSNVVEIYGNHGMPLIPGEVTQRYSRFPNRVYSGTNTAPYDMKAATEARLELVNTAVKSWRNPEPKPIGKSIGTLRLEARPILLTRKECLSCHKGMKLNQPVALMLYSVVPFTKAK